MSRIGALLLILILVDVSNPRILAAAAAAAEEDKVSPSPSPGPEPGNLKLSPPLRKVIPNPPPRKAKPSPPLLPPPPLVSGDKGGVDLCGAEVDKCKADELVACLTHFGDESKELFLLVHNGGEMNLTVTIRSSLVEGKIHNVTLAKHDSEQISLSTNVTDVIEIVLNAGKKNCLLYVRPSISDWIHYQQFHAYASRLTPIHGAYVLFASMFIAGGTWACCKFGRKSKRGGSGVPYQQLEMATQVETVTSVADRNGVDGWDDSWDEGWDEEQAVVRPSENHPTNVSSNGLSSRAPNKDGWDDEWDD